MHYQDRRSTLFRSIQAALACGAAAVVGFMIFAGEPAQPLWWLGFLLFAAWGLVPFAIVYRFAQRNAASERALWVMLTAATFLAAGGFFVLRDAFLLHPDAQSGILFVVLPVWQSIALIPFLAVARRLSSPSS